jgi:hypothetical protein
LFTAISTRSADEKITGEDLGTVSQQELKSRMAKIDELLQETADVDQDETKNTF